MTNRNPAFVMIISPLTLGIYFIYWLAVSRGEMNAKGADIPTTWIVIIPFVNLWYKWRWTKGVSIVTKNKVAAGSSYLLLSAFPFGLAYIQDAFKEVK